MFKTANPKLLYFLVISIVIAAVGAILLTSDHSIPSTPLPPKIKIAFLPATFSSAAYQHDVLGNHVKFYDFYSKYGKTPLGVNITTDLDELTSVVSSSKHDHQGYVKAFTNSIETILPDAVISEINDTDVHEGGIFLADGSNAFNIIILLHEEYVTQQMYDNFKHFVSNGGTLLFIDANVFYAEVKYDKEKNSITLVKGHGWEFDGTVAKKGILERWLNETREWVGSNYWEKGVQKPIIFADNPFNYTHWEENYVDNYADKIIYDYKAKDLKGKTPSPTIATYELHYGKGKVIMMGLGAETLYKNEKFLNFFNSLILRSIQDH